MEITRELFLTATGLALVVLLAVEVLKRWLKLQKDEWWYGALINTVAILLGFVAAYAAFRANNVTIDEPALWFFALQAFIIGALATGGYEYVANLIVFVGGVRNRNGEGPPE